MEDFDFTTPINATVIFEDSDDENKQYTGVIDKEIETNNTNSSNILLSRDELCKENVLENKSSKPITTNNIEDEIRNVSSKNETLESIRIKRLDSGLQEWVVISNDKSRTEVQNNQKSQTPLDMPSQFDDNTTLQDIINQTININTQKIDTQNKPDYQKQGKRRKSLSKPKRRLSKKRDSIEESDKAESSKNNSSSTEINQTIVPVSSLVDLDSAQPLPKLHKYRHQTTVQLRDSIGIPVNIIKNNYQQQPTTEDSSQSINAINQAVSNYLGELLNAVSENMIYIVNSYQTYARLNKINIERSLVEHAKNNYMRTKFHFFDLSYASVLNIIIPREKDLAFVTDFINSTIKLAHSKSYLYTYLQMEPLYLEMIDWVKKRENQILSLKLKSHSNLLLSERLKDKRNLPLYPNTDPGQIQKCQAQQQYPSNTESNIDCHNSSVMSEGNMKVGSTNLQNQCVYPINEQRCYSVIMPPLKKQEVSKISMHNTQMQQKSTCGLYTHVRSLLNQTTNQQPLSTFSVLPNVAFPWQNQSTPAHSTARNYQEPYKQPLPNFNVLPNVASPWQNQPIVPHAVPKNHQELDKQISPILNAFQNNASPWLNQAAMAQSYQDRQLPQNNQDLHLEITNPAELNRSSISRDSGFISPPGFNSNTDHLQCNVHEEHNSGLTPLISHVTSLNPDVSYISEGVCAVCGKTTKKKCLGCYNYYYCSQSCQYLDWKKHMTECIQEITKQGEAD